MNISSRKLITKLVLYVFGLIAIVWFGLIWNFLSGNAIEQSAKFDVAEIVAACGGPKSSISTQNVIVDGGIFGNEYIFTNPETGSIEFHVMRNARDSYYCFSYFGCFTKLKFECPK